MKRECVSLLLIALAFASICAITFISAQNFQAEVEFITGTFICNSTATTAAWINSSSGQLIPVNDTAANCNKYSHESVPSCCPTNFHCNTTTGKCEDGLRITDCTKYASQKDCNADDMKVGLASVLNSSNCGVDYDHPNKIGDDVCYNMTRCGCVWEGSATVGNCSAKKIYTTECPTNTIAVGNCTWSTFSSVNRDCSNINLPITISSTATWVPSSVPRPADCADVSRTYPCASVERLPFFTLTSFMISLTAIALIYAILIRRR